MLRVEFPGTTNVFVANDVTPRDVAVIAAQRSGGVLFRATIKLQDLPSSAESSLVNYPPDRRTQASDGSFVLEGLLLVEPGRFRLVDNPIRPSLEAVIPHNIIPEGGLPMTLRRVDLASTTTIGAQDKSVVVHPLN